MYVYTFTYDDKLIDIYRIIVYRPIHLQYVGIIIYRGPQPIQNDIKAWLAYHDPSFLNCGDEI